MRGIVISESLVIRKGVAEILSNEECIDFLDEKNICVRTYIMGTMIW